MNWMILFWVCSAVCQPESLTLEIKPEAKIISKQKVLFYDGLTEASLAQRRLILGMKLEEYLTKDEKLCSEVQLFKIEKKVSK